MNHDLDTRASRVLADCLPARLAGRAIDLGGAAWSASAARRLLAITADRRRFWLVTAVTAVVVALAGTVLGVAP